MAYVLYSGIVSGQRRWNSPWVIAGAVASGAAIIRDTHIPATGKHIIACAEDVNRKLADAGQKALGAVAKTAQTVAALSPPKITFRRTSTMPQREPNPSTSINSCSFSLPVLPQDLEKNSAQPVDEATTDSSASREQDAHIVKADGALEHVLFSHSRPARASSDVEPTIHDGEDRTLSSSAGSQMAQAPSARRSRAKGWVDQISLFVGATNSKRSLALEAAGGILKTGADALKSKVEGVVGATQVAGLALATNILRRAKTRSLRYWVNIAAHHISAFARRNGHLASLVSSRLRAGCRHLYFVGAGNHNDPWPAGCLLVVDDHSLACALKIGKMMVNMLLNNEFRIFDFRFSDSSQARPTEKGRTLDLEARVSPSTLLTLQKGVRGL